MSDTARDKITIHGVFGKAAQALSWSFPNSLNYQKRRTTNEKDLPACFTISFVHGVSVGSGNINNRVDNIN